MPRFSSKHSLLREKKADSARFFRSYRSTKRRRALIFLPPFSKTGESFRTSTKSSSRASAVVGVQDFGLWFILCLELDTKYSSCGAVNVLSLISFLGVMSTNRDGLQYINAGTSVTQGKFCFRDQYAGNGQLLRSANLHHSDISQLHSS